MRREDGMKASDYVKEGLAGATAGAVGTLLGYPLDSIKTNMQTSQQPFAQVIRSIYSKEGVVGFYRGIGSPLVSLIFLNTLNFSSYATFRSWVGAQPLEEGGRSFEWRIALAGACAGPFAGLISTPFEMVKMQQQLGKRSGQTSEAKRGSLEMARSLVRQHGFSSLYLGHVVNTVREVAFLSTYFMVYEHFKMLISGSFLSSNVAIPISGGLAGALGWLISFPLDNIKSHIQGGSLQADGSRQKLYSFDVFGKILRQKGFLGLYTGVAPSILRAFLVSGSRFTAYEACMQTMDEMYVQE